MSEWISAPLENLTDFQKGKKVETSPYRLAGYDRYLGAGSLAGGHDGYASTFRSVQATENDVLMLWDGERSGLVGHDLRGVVSSTVSKLTPKGKICGHLLYYYLLLNFEWIQNRRTGTGVPHVPKDLARILKLTFPANITLQKKIARILSTLDDAIEKTDELIGKYEQIKAGLMHDLFTRGLTADGKLRPPRSEAPHLYHETPVGWIPKEWTASKMITKAAPGIPHLQTGPFGSALKGEHWVQEGHPVITIGALGEGYFINSELLHIGDYDAKRLRTFRLKLGDVVFSRVADVGRSVAIQDNQVGWIMSSNLMKISLDRKQVLSEFLQYQLSSDSRVKNQIHCKVNSGGREVANSEILNSILFVWPSFGEQKAMVERASAVDNRMVQEQIKRNKLHYIKSGLLHDLLTGRVPVRVEEEEAADVG